jgi:hypothetical protein
MSGIFQQKTSSSPMHGSGHHRNTSPLLFVVHTLLFENDDTSLADSGLRSQNLVLDRHCFL